MSQANTRYRPRIGFVVLFGAVALVGVCAGWWFNRQAARRAVDGFEQSLRRAAIELEQARYGTVIEQLKTIPDRHQLAAQAHFLRAEAYAGLKHWSLAEAEYRKALEYEPLHVDAAWGLLDLLFKQERIAEARQLCAEFYRRDPDPNRRVLWLIEAIRQEHERIAPAESLRLLEEVAHRDTRNVYVLRLAARQYIRLGRLTEGIAMFQRSLKLAPEDVETWYYLISSLYEQGEFDRLDLLWEKLPENAASDPRVLRYQGQWYEAKGKLDRAIAAFRAAVDRAPYDRKALYALAQALRRKGLESEANSYAERARTIDRAREQLGQLYLRMRARRYDPTPEQCEEAATLWETMGETEQADLWRKEATARRQRSK